MNLHSKLALIFSLGLFVIFVYLNQTNSGRLLSHIDDFVIYNFCCSATDIVHFLYPQQHIICF